MTDRESLLAAARAAHAVSDDAYRSALAIYADWLEERGDSECEKIRRMLPACAWAREKAVLLTDCELSPDGYVFAFVGASIATYQLGS